MGLSFFNSFIENSILLICLLYDLTICKLSVNEKIKNLKIANRIIELLLKNNFNRSDCVIAFGGGVIGDLSGFVSSLTKRGIKFINIPTTLLAQVDASLGGKTGINSNQGKNLIGTYYQPDFILSDVSILKSLPQREIISGYGEILKHSMILDRKTQMAYHLEAQRHNRVAITNLTALTALQAEQLCRGGQLRVMLLLIRCIMCAILGYSCIKRLLNTIIQENITICIYSRHLLREAA